MAGVVFSCLAAGLIAGFALGFGIGEHLEGSRWRSLARWDRDKIRELEDRNEHLNRNLASCQGEILSLRRKIGIRSLAYAGGHADEEPWTTSQES